MHNLNLISKICFCWITSCLFLGVARAADPICTPSCLGWSPVCSQADIIDTPADSPVRVLPWSWSHADTNTTNDVCLGLNCNAGISAYSTNQMNRVNGVCTWANSRALPSAVTCIWKDGSCSQVCSGGYSTCP